jgi:hypothetical protein
MKGKLIVAVSAAIFSLLFFLAYNFYSSSERFEKDSDETEEAERETYGIDKELMSWYQAKGFPDPSYMTAKYLSAWEYALQMKEYAKKRNQYNGLMRGQGVNGNWTSLGPDNGTGGRVLTIAINPVKTTSIFVGAASGGIWKSYNGASSWQQVTTNLPVLGVTSIIINPSDTNVLYAGTGEIYRLDTSVNTTTPNPNNSGYNVWKTRGTYGIGILKSTNGGTTWRQVLIKNTSNLFGIQRLRFNPLNPKTVFACATDGLYRSRDSGANWTRILNLTMVTDVVINAKDTNQIVAAVGNLGNTVKGIFRTTNDGSSWAKISSALPATFRGFIKLDNISSLGNRDTIIASIGVDETGSPNELYRSADFGATWAAKASSTHTSYQFWSAHTVAINPFFTDSLAYAGVNSFKYKISTSVSAGTAVGHADNHDIQFDPLVRGTYYVACDGGIYKTTNGGTSFTKVNTGLAVSQFYASIGVSSSDANYIVGGLQDINVMYTTNGGSTWANYPGAAGGDGAACFIDPTSDTTLISNDARAVNLATTKGGSAASKLSYLGAVADSRTGFVSPLAISKTNPHVIYVGSDNIHKSTNGGTTWTGGGTGTTVGTSYIDKIHRPALTLEIAPNDANRVYVSTTPFAQADNDVDTLFVDRTKGSDILRTTDGGTTLPFTSIKTNLPDRYVLDMYVSPTNKDSVWVTLGGFGTAHIYVTANAGASPASNVVWTAKDAGPSSGGLPDVPTNAIIFDPNNPNVIYVGNDLGIYVSPDKGNTWFDYNNGLWDVNQVVDLRITADNNLLAATHGKGIFKSGLYTGGLPVNFTSITGYNAGNTNELKWNVAQEINLSHYEVERSIDGRNFKKIGTVTAKDSWAAISYNYSDNISGETSSLYYYRVKSVDDDGSYQYSETVVIKVNRDIKFKLIGNPFTDYFKIQFSATSNQQTALLLFDMQGKLIRRKQFNAVAGINEATFDNLAVLPKGVYVFEMYIDQKRNSRKVIHQ